MSDMLQDKLPPLKNEHPKFVPRTSIRQRIGGVGDLIYRGVLRRTSTFVLAIVLGAFFFERGFDKTGNMIFEKWNKGKLWKDIKHNYEGKTSTDDSQDEAAPEATEE